MKGLKIAGAIMAVIVLLIISIAIETGGQFFGAWKGAAIERVVHANSYQKKNADEDGSLIFQGQLALIEAQLRSPALPEEERYALEAQRASIRIQMQSLQN